MSIFESLENLNVSEECFEDIMGIVEELLNEGINSLEKRIEDKHGKADWGTYKGEENKSAKLIDKLRSASKREQESAAKRDNIKKLRISTNIDDWIDSPRTVHRYSQGLEKAKSKIIQKRHERNKGNFYPFADQYTRKGNNDQFVGENPPSDVLGSYKRAEEKSIARHNKKENK